ncbi:MAG: PVC-type heme-binding CxxCH protein [Rubripirellula sp.]
MNCFRFTFLVLALTTNAAADFPKLFNSEPISDESLMPAEEAAAKMQLPEGFKATVFASEPDVQNPIAMSWDARGRLWVAENYTYAERAQRFQLDLRDRVVIFDNTSGDHFKKRTVFTDDVQMLTGIEVGLDGVWLMCPPQLIFLPDRDHDDVPDSAGEVVLDGFTVAQQNYHNFANGLQFGPDGWLYGRCGGSCPGRIGVPGAPDHHRLAMEGGMWRYHPSTGDVEVLTTGTTNPWGHDWNDVGEAFFVNTVNGHLWHMIPGAHFTRPFTLDPNRRTYELIDFHADHWHFDTGASWTKSRDGAANSFGGGHAHSGTMIYDGENWPAKYRGKLFTLNFHGRRANQEKLVHQGSGYVAKHDEDFFLAADPWFRGMELGSGPDGGVFVLDWSDAGECHEHTGVHRTSGRIYKITYEQTQNSAGQTPNMLDWKSSDFESATLQDESQVRRQRMELASRRAHGEDLSSVINATRQRFATSQNDRDLVQTLLTLHVTGGTDNDFLRAQLKHSNAHVRCWAIRLLTEHWPVDDALGPVWKTEDKAEAVKRSASQVLPDLCDLGANDASPLVRLTLASTLQRLPVGMRASLAEKLVSHSGDAEDHNLPLMIWYGLIAVAEENAADLVGVAKACRLPTTLRLISRCLAEEIERSPAAINDLLQHAADANSDGFKSTVLEGVAEGLKGWRRATKPAAWDRLASTDLPVIRELSVVFGDGRAMDELKAIVTGKVEAEPTTRLDALQTLIDQEPEDLRSICESLLGDGRMNVLAARGLSRFDDPAIGKAIVSRYRNFRGPYRPQIMSILVSRRSFADAMLQAIEKGKIPRQDLSAFQVRQIHSLGDDGLSRRVGEVWGEVRDSPEDKRQAIESTKKLLSRDTIATSNKQAGRVLFQKHCQTCHKLFGEGATIGPDLTGANRNDLDYLLGNIIDPSAVVDKDFRMTILLLEDDRIINGLVTTETDRTLTMQTATESLTIRQDSIQSRKVTEKSPMPDGLLESLSETQIKDLVGYLQAPSQVSLP